MHHWRRRLAVCVGGVLVPLALLVGLPTGPGFGAVAAIVTSDDASTVSVCRRNTLSRPPLWTGSGAWNGRDLVLVDTIRRSLLAYSEDGRARMDLPGSLSKSWSDLYPIRLAVRDDSRLVVQAEANRFLTLDPEYAAEGNMNTLLKAGPNGSTIEKVFTWAPAKGDIVAFADVKAPGDRWGAGVVRFSTDLEATSHGFQLLNDLSPQDASRKFHRLGFSYIAALGDTAYYLLMDNGFHLWKSDPGKDAEDMKDLTESFPSWKSSPQLPSYVMPEDFTSVMETIEGSAFPTGLYGWRDPVSGERSLYLLSRQPQNGVVQWLLSRIDPASGDVTGTVLIQSHANHLFAIPGPVMWAFVEKGPALGLTEQEVGDILTIPAERVRSSLERSARGNGKQVPVDICK